ncbi:MAG: 2-oxo-4-hydroxy-4-carboxy-5-ureidoimidazoline decarboxylase [Candidatus Protistobacter heckmanni]|nr:2-oxo-4-hydroxy-4-carboxy-5-ureidoimidazoline decarboxylase [Candidatus Protistobacter heckmanni]
MNATATLSIAELNAMSLADFVTTLDTIFEHSPWVVECAAEKRPFADIAALHAAMVAEIEAAGAEAQMKLILTHPELAGKAAVRGELTDESTREQKGAGLDQCSSEEFTRLQMLNGAYREKFGFPFILAVRGHTRASVIESFVRRLEHGRNEEIKACLEQIYRIGLFRLQDLVGG